MIKKTVGAPKRYINRMKILHSIEAKTLHRLNKMASFGTSRTDIINEAINEYLERKKK